MKARKEQIDEELMVLKLFAINYARDLLYILRDLEMEVKYHILLLIIKVKLKVNNLKQKLYSYSNINQDMGLFDFSKKTYMLNLWKAI